MKRNLKQALKKATGLDVTRQETKVYTRNTATGNTDVLMRFGNMYVTSKTKELTIPAAYVDAITLLPGQGAVVED